MARSYSTLYINYANIINEMKQELFIETNAVSCKKYKVKKDSPKNKKQLDRVALLDLPIVANQVTAFCD